MKNEVGDGNRDNGKPGDCSHDTYRLEMQGKALWNLSHPANSDGQNGHDIIMKTELEKKPAPNPCLG